MFFFFNDTATTEIYTLSLTRRSSDLILLGGRRGGRDHCDGRCRRAASHDGQRRAQWLALQSQHHRRSEEHTSEIQSPPHLVCRPLLEKKKTQILTLTQCHTPNMCVEQ